MTKEAETDAERVKARARDLGFEAARITAPDAPAHAEQVAAWLGAAMHGGMGYLEKRAHLRGGPLDSPFLLQDTRSVVLVALSYDFPVPKPENRDKENLRRGVVARYARGKDYHDVLWEKLKALGAWIEETWPGARTRGFADSGPIRERELAARAGIGWQGKHTNLISLDLGNFFFLGALLTTLPLSPDEPVEGHCGTCTRCLAACPTGAIVAPLTLDARRCVSYLTIEHRGPISKELRSLMGNRIFGCDDCLAVCPWNKGAQRGREMRLAAPNEERAFPDLLSLLALLETEEGFRARFGGTPLLRPKREGLRRNVLIALGNEGGAESIGPIGDALQSDPAPVVRGAAAWALGEIGRRGDRNVVDALRAAQAAETDADTLEEINAALCLLAEA